VVVVLYFNALDE